MFFLSGYFPFGNYNIHLLRCFANTYFTLFKMFFNFSFSSFPVSLYTIISGFTSSISQTFPNVSMLIILFFLRFCKVLSERSPYFLIIIGETPFLLSISRMFSPLVTYLIILPPPLYFIYRLYFFGGVLSIIFTP